MGPIERDRHARGIASTSELERVVQPADERFLLVRELRRNDELAAKLVRRLIDREADRVSRLEQRPRGAAYVYGLEVAAMLSVRAVRKAEPFELGFHPILHVEILHVEGTVMDHTLTIRPVAGGLVGLDEHVHHLRRAAVVHLVPDEVAVLVGVPVGPAVLQEVIHVSELAQRDSPAVEAAAGILLWHILGFDWLARVADVLDQLEIDRASRVLQTD